jgi:hypothetical protein
LEFTLWLDHRTIAGTVGFQDELYSSIYAKVGSDRFVPITFRPFSKTPGY